MMERMSSIGRLCSLETELGPVIVDFRRHEH